MSTWNNLLKHYISPDFLLIESQVQGALRKALLIATFVELFQTITLEKPYR